MNQRVNNIVRGRAKDEPVEDNSFLESLLSWKEY
jgi:hypothetical protein